MASTEKKQSLALPTFDAPAPTLLIIAAPFYREITDQLISGARAVIDRAGGHNELAEVPGALEIPAAIRLASRHYEGFVALGCVVRGENHALRNGLQ